MIADSRARVVRLEDLVRALPQASVRAEPGALVSGVAHDSRALRAGDLFVALRGERSDGHAFLAQAVAAGACAVVVDAEFAGGGGVPPGMPYVVVPDTRRALSALAATYYEHPSASLRVTGVTGTNGKTTTTYLIAAALAAAGIPTGRIGTLGAAFGGTTQPLGNTTPPALELQATLADMLERGARAVVLEVSSHALALERVADVAFECGVLTNVTREHLDFHATLEAYAAAKRRLFASARTAILCADDDYGRRWAAELMAEGRAVVTYGLSAGAAVRALRVETRAAGSEFVVDGQRFRLPLPGRFNVQNALAALCVARAMGVDDASSARAFAGFESVPGRMQHFAADGIDVFVDYAHTPDALQTVLQALRAAVQGRLTVVFGCGGDRDRGKRPEMGRVAWSGADRVILTSDNPRRERAEAIAADVMAGMPTGGALVELDRRAAIRRAVSDAAPGDVVLVAGKGHETHQVAGDRAEPFDDCEEVRAALAAREAGLAR